MIASVVYRVLGSINLFGRLLGAQQVVCEGSIFHEFALISNAREISFTGFCCGRHLCNTFLKFYMLVDLVMYHFLGNS